MHDHRHDTEPPRPESEVPDPPPSEVTRPDAFSDPHAALVSEIAGSVARLLHSTLTGIHAELRLIRAENELLRCDVQNLKQGLELQQQRCQMRHGGGVDFGDLGAVDGHG